MTAQEIAAALKNRLLQMEAYAQAKAETWGEANVLMSKLYEAMEEQGIPKVNIGELEFKPSDNRDFSLRNVDTIKFDDCEQFFDFLKDNQLDGIIKTKRSVHAGTRKKVLKDWVDEGNPLPEFIEEKFYQTIKWNKSLVTKMVTDAGA